MKKSVRGLRNNISQESFKGYIGFVPSGSEFYEFDPVTFEDVFNYHLDPEVVKDTTKWYFNSGSRKMKREKRKERMHKLSTEQFVCALKHSDEIPF